MFPLWASPPPTINLQGTLQAANGSPVSGTHAYQLRIYSAPTGGSLLQSSTGTLACSSAGRYSIALVPAPGVIVAGTVYYDLAVDANDNGLDAGDLFPGRVPVHSVPFALLARDSEQLGGVVAAQYATDAELSTGLAAKAPLDHGHEGQYWSLAGNVVSPTEAHPLGTLNDAPLELWAGGLPALRLVPNATSPNLIGGHSDNFVFPGVQGGFIGSGGDSSVGINQVLADYGSVAGGRRNVVSAEGAAVVGGFTNSASGVFSFVGGGQDNIANWEWATVAGGNQNVAYNSSSTVAGGGYNQAKGIYSAVAGGFFNQASGEAALVGGGMYNIAGGEHAVVAGGGGLVQQYQSMFLPNQALGDYSTIGGGAGNLASGYFTTVAGGQQNSATAYWSIAVGGCRNVAAGDSSTVAGGGYNLAHGKNSMVGGGFYNEASGEAALVGGGTYNVAGGKYSVVAGGGGLVDRGVFVRNQALGDYSAIGGGSGNRAYGFFTIVAGGLENSASGEFTTIGGGSDNAAAAANATVAGGLRNSARGVLSAVAGGYLNEASGYTSCVGGGSFNRAYGRYSVVAGGGVVLESQDLPTNQALGDYSAIGGGGGNVAAERYAVVAGGQENSASGEYAAVGGGVINQALGKFAVVPGGRDNLASGDFSFAAGRRAHASNQGAFVWADSTDADFSDYGADSFNVRAGGGARIEANNTSYGAYVQNDSNGDGLRSLANTSRGDNYAAVYAHNSGTSPGLYAKSTGGSAAYLDGNVTVVGTLTKGGGSFKIDHPLDPTHKYLSHSFVESPDMMNVYNGNVILDGSGEATVQLPDWFGALNRDCHYQLTCIGAFAPVYIKEKITDNRFKIAGGSAALEVSWQVTGIRQDAYANAHRIAVEEEKPLAERGHYLHPEAYGEPVATGVAAKETARVAAETHSGLAGRSATR